MGSECCLPVCQSAKHWNKNINGSEACDSCLQVAGLKYFDDMQQRIPRTEVEQVHSLVSEVVKEVLAVDGVPDADRLHCRVTGSYIRGKPMTGSTCCSHTLAVSLWMQHRREAAHAANKSAVCAGRSGLCRQLYAHTQLPEQLAYCCISHQASTEGWLVQVRIILHRCSGHLD